MALLVRNKETGKIYSMDKHLFESKQGEFEEVAKAGEVKEVPYADLKKKAKELGFKFKGNISRTKLEEMIKE